MSSSTRLLLETLRIADGGTVEVQAETPYGRVSSVIEKAFFEDFMGQDDPVIPTKRRVQIIEDNVEWLATEIDRQMMQGVHSVVIR